MKKPSLTCRWFCAQLAISLCAFAGLAADTRIDSSAEGEALAKQAETKLQQASTTKDFQDVAWELENALQSDPLNHQARKTLGWIYLEKTHQPKAAYHHLAIVAKSNPNDVDARKLYGMACSQTGRWERAIEEFRQASALKPDDLWIKANLAKAHARIGEFRKADGIYAEIMAADLENADARLGKAELLAWRGHSVAPIEQLNQLVSENPTNVEALTLRGDIHRWNWQLSEAEKNYNQALDVAPGQHGAITGLEQAERMGASDISLKGYIFKDTTSFRRESVGLGTRLHLTDKAYFLARGAGWRFTHPAFEDLDRIDVMGGLEYHWSRWFETSVEAGQFKYEHRNGFFGGRGSLKLSPTPRFDIYAALSINQPFVSSMATVSNALREDSIGAGFDAKLGSRFSVQGSFQLARISDDNEWAEAKPQLSYRLFDVPATFIRAEYQYLDFAETNATYWTPQHRNTASPVLDTAIPLGKRVQLVLSGKAPYVFEESEFGFQGEGGLSFDFRHVQFKVSYNYSEIPGDQGAWSGHGGQASLRFLF